MKLRRLVLAAVAVTLSGCPEDSPPVTTGGVTSSPLPSPSASATGAATAASSAAPSASAALSEDAPARPLYYDELIIGDKELAHRTLRELSLMRNTIYARAGNSFRRPWLHAHFSAQPWYQPKEQMDESKITVVDRENARRIAEHDASLTREALEAMRDTVLARRKAGRALPEDDVELSLLSQRLGTPLGGSEDAAPTPLEDPSQLDRVLKLEELSTLSRRDLRILRNTIYARKGRTFDSAVVRSYFEGASWYKPKADYDDSVLTAVDHKNVAIIRSVEDSLGGPLHENPNFGKDGWFILA